LNVKEEKCAKISGDKKMKQLSVVLIVLAMASAAKGTLTLKVNGLDTSKIITVEGGDEIVIEVAGQTDEQVQSPSVTCEIGGKLEKLADANTSAEKQKEYAYVFNFDDEGSGLAVINLAKNDILDYQLVLFKIPGIYTVIFGIDSDNIEVAKQKKENEPQECDEAHIPSNSTFEPGVSVNCPNDKANSEQLESFSFSTIGKDVQAAMGQGSYTELQEITDSVFLDPNVLYYVPDPPLLIHGTGEGIDVVIPSGTIIVLSEDWDYGIRVYDGANVYFGEPVPEANEPNTIYQPGDTNNPAPPVWIFGEDPNVAFVHNFCGLLIERTAGPEARLSDH